MFNSAIHKPIFCVVVVEHWLNKLLFLIRLTNAHHIHNIDPSTFNLQELMTAAILLRRENEVVPTQFWYHPHGRNWPSGLVTIDGDNHIRDMWRNVTDHDEKEAVVVMQDTAWEENPKTHALIYALPGSMTCDPSSLHPTDVLNNAITEMYHVTSNPFPMVMGFNVIHWFQSMLRFMLLFMLQLCFC